MPLASRRTPVGSRQAFFGKWREVPVYALSNLRPSHFLEGPAIVEAETTTVVVDRVDHITVNSQDTLPSCPTDEFTSSSESIGVRR